MVNRYQFNEEKCRELFAAKHAAATKIHVHLSKDPEAYWNGIPVFHHGQWDVEHLAIVNNFIDKEPIIVKFGAITSLECSTELQTSENYKF